MRARDAGLVAAGLLPGPLNAIGDVAGVWVGRTALIRGEGALLVGGAAGAEGIGQRMTRMGGWQIHIRRIRAVRVLSDF